MVFPKNQAPWRMGCSLRVYHIDTMIDMPGAMPDSAIPKKKRVASKPPALEHVAVSMRMAPQESL